MSLNKGKLKTDIEKLLTDMMQKEKPSFEEFADRLSTAIDSYVKKATVNAGISVSTTGSAMTQTGVTTTIGTLS